MTAKTETITVLSVRQPFAAALLELDKWAEIRNWRYPTRYRGPVFIHSSRWEARPPADIYAGEPWLLRLWDSPSPLTRVTGAIIGRIDVVHAADDIDVTECFDVLAGQSSRKLTPSQLALMPFLPPVGKMDESDPWRWWNGGGIIVCRNPAILKEPIPTGGKLNLWKFPVESERLVFREQQHSRKRRRRAGGRLDDPENE